MAIVTGATKITTRRNSRISEDDLQNIVSSYSFGRHCEDPTLDLNASRRYVLHTTRNYLSSCGIENNLPQCIEAIDADRQTVGILLLKMSHWDTNHFGYPCASIDSILIKNAGYEERSRIAAALLAHLESWLQSKQVRFASLRISALDLAVIHNLERHNFNFIESWVFNHLDTRKVKLADKPEPLRLATAADKQVMLSYTKGAFDTQRFHADTRVNRHKADSLYQKWIETSFDDPNMRTLVLDVNSKPVAFMTYFEADLNEFFNFKVAMWKMALLDPESRGKGLGTRFFYALSDYHSKEGLSIIDSGVSMRNLVSLNLHNKCGFKISSTLLTFHKWLC